MNKVFTFQAGSKCDGCLRDYEDYKGNPFPLLPFLAVLTAEGPQPGQHFFIALKQFCSEKCRNGYVEELNCMTTRPHTFGYELVKGGT